MSKRLSDAEPPQPRAGSQPTDQGFKRYSTYAQARASVLACTEQADFKMKVGR
jgi:hypothetical protein